MSIIERNDTRMLSFVKKVYPDFFEARSNQQAFDTLCLELEQAQAYELMLRMQRIYNFCDAMDESVLMERLFDQFGVVWNHNMKLVTGEGHLLGTYKELAEKYPRSMKKLVVRFEFEK